MLKDRFLIFLILLSCLLLFLNLGDRVLFVDEGYTVVKAKTVLEHGYPYPFYGNIEVNPAGTYFILGKIPVFNWNTWMQHYLTAVPYHFFGMHEFWLRFPFALAGLATILLFYNFVRKITQDTFVIRSASILLATSSTFLLHFRVARWYAISALFALATYYTYWNWVNGEGSFPFVLCSVLLFHSQMLIFLSVMFSVALYHIMYEIKKRSLKEVAGILVAVAFFTLPWMLATGQFSAKSGGITLNPGRIALNLGINFFYITILLMPLILIVFLLLFMWKKKKHPAHIFMFMGIIGSVLFLSLRSPQLPAIRYLLFLVPFFSHFAAVCLRYLYRISSFLSLGVFVLLICTNAIHIIPFVPLQQKIPHFEAVPPEVADDFLKDAFSPRVPLFDFLYEISHPYHNGDEAVVKLLLEQGGPEDSLATSHSIHLLVAYVNMEVSPSQKNAESFYKTTGQTPSTQPPTWIIVRGFKLDSSAIADFRENMDQLYGLENYQKIIIPFNDEERWASAPDPINHKYRTDATGNFSVYKRKEDSTIIVG